MKTDRAYTIALSLALLAFVLDILGWLGPRDCPVCLQPRTLADRIRGIHECKP